MNLLRLLLLCSVLFGPHAALAVEPDEMLADPGLEQRARSLSRELRCMVCQNQSIDDSAAPLARDLRILVRERLKAGDSDQQVLDFLVARYGEFVLLKPRFEGQTALLWMTPLVVLLLGATAIVFAMRRQNRTAVLPDTVLSASEQARMSELMSPRGE
jgi:cytochrome c-type biogenesis protein CcmH